MNRLSDSELTEKIVEKAKSLGASVAGVADVESLKASPSHRLYPKIGMNLESHPPETITADLADEVFWPADAVSAVVIGVAHDADTPELDWWDGKGTPGNRILIRINNQLSEWIAKTFSIKTHKRPYLIEKGGIFLKDAAVMAGLGCVGMNNLVITPEYGPRVRFRALLLNRRAEPTGPMAFHPCEGCEQPCRSACPVNAFETPLYSADEMGQSVLPGVNGTYDRVTCNTKMETDIEEAVMGIPASDESHRDIRRTINEFEGDPAVAPVENQRSVYCVRYCRRCELSCPVGR